MLFQLAVRNFALIENIKLDLNDGFTVVTGETGSGKSILLGALKLILGERADYSVIRNKNEKTIVEATFQLNLKNYKELFEKYDLDFESETIIRREINAAGKSRAFINDTPVQLTALKELTERLIHIHSQHHTIDLKNKSFQLSFLDVMAGNSELLQQIHTNYFAIKDLTQELISLEEKRSKLELEADFNAFQLEELTSLSLEKVNYEEIENEVKRGEQFEEIKEAYQLITHSLDGEGGILEQLVKIKQIIKVSDSNLNELIDRISSVYIELQDINSITQDDLSELFYDPEKLESNIQQLDSYNAALRKHNLKSQDELQRLFKQLSEELIETNNIEETIELKKLELENLKAATFDLAKMLSESRKTSAKSIESELIKILNHLKLKESILHFTFDKKELSSNGIDDVSIYFSPNKGISAQPIEKAASGGELSRLMLAIQFLLSQKQELPTVIFDEIDTGVSGEVAQKIGEHLKNMGERMQLIAITHLPQVASKGMHHITVRKNLEDDITKTSIFALTKEERIEEIAKLMSGSKINEAALMNAKNLMNE